MLCRRTSIRSVRDVHICAVSQLKLVCSGIAQGAGETRSQDERSGYVYARFTSSSRVQVCVWPVSQSVKEVVQSLVDDGLVQMDKIGASNCEYNGVLTNSNWYSVLTAAAV